MNTIELTRDEAKNLLSLITALDSRRGTLRQMEDALRTVGNHPPAAFLHDLRQTIALGSFTLQRVTEQCRRQAPYCHDISEEIRQ